MKEKNHFLKKTFERDQRKKEAFNRKKTEKQQKILNLIKVVKYSDLSLFRIDIYYKIVLVTEQTNKNHRERRGIRRAPRKSNQF
jgi:hypothetical protein